MVMPYSSNMSLVNPADMNVMQTQNPYGSALTNAMQAPQMTMPQQGMSQMDMYRMMGQGIQNMGRGMQMQMPSGNTAQIMRDQSRPQFVGSPQQQMAQALRRR